jgi:hypothetical protein
LFLGGFLVARNIAIETVAGSSMVTVDIIIKIFNYILKIFYIHMDRASCLLKPSFLKG